jgi:lysine 2,3-aminomutase
MMQIDSKYFDYNKKRLYRGINESLWSSYKWHLANRINNIYEIRDKFPKLKIDGIDKIAANLKFSITPYTACLINPESTKDPIATQIIPSSKELIQIDELKIDPFDEKGKSPVNNVIKRFSDRIIVISTNVCAGYCRYCTRKRIWNESTLINDKKLEAIIDYLKKNKNIREVIISGGEPLLLSEELIDKILKKIFSVKHIESLRIGTRILTFLPQRINKKLIKIISKYKPIWIMTHFNHCNEITRTTEEAIDRLLDSGAVLANQSVLLKDINDDYESLKNLNHKLQRSRIFPYYLFQCDLISGTNHFRASIDDGVRIIKKLRENTGGIAVPTYIIDLAEGGKVPISPEYIIKTTSNKIFIKSCNNIVEYPNTKKPYLIYHRP